MAYKIVGDRSVAGRNPGEVLTDEELAGCNVPALIESGHLVTTATTADKSADEQADTGRKGK